MEQIVTKDNMSKIRIVRGSQFADLRSYRILINGEMVGAVGAGGVLEMEVPAGSLVIEARIDWGCSRPLTIEAAPRQTIEIEVSRNLNAYISL
jgi:hypothetical protein